MAMVTFMLLVLRPNGGTVTTEFASLVPADAPALQRALVGCKSTVKRRLGRQNVVISTRVCCIPIPSIHSISRIESVARGIISHHTSGGRIIGFIQLPKGNRTIGQDCSPRRSRRGTIARAPRRPRLDKRQACPHD